jgi:hypothetical protein
LLGKNIDEFVATNLVGNFAQGAGGQNFIIVRDAAKAAIKGNQEKKTLVKNYFLSERIGLGRILDTPEVSNIRTGKGPKASPLPEEWYRTLLRDGIINVVSQGASGVTTLLDLEIGAWNHPRVENIKHDNNHNDHWHIELFE